MATGLLGSDKPTRASESVNQQLRLVFRRQGLSLRIHGNEIRRASLEVNARARAGRAPPGLPSERIHGTLAKNSRLQLFLSDKESEMEYSMPDGGRRRPGIPHSEIPDGVRPCHRDGGSNPVHCVPSRPFEVKMRATQRRSGTLLEPGRKIMSPPQLRQSCVIWCAQCTLWRYMSPRHSRNQRRLRTLQALH